MSRALFLDRDGVVDELVYYPSHDEWESPRRVADLVMLPDVSEPLRRFHEAGWLLFIVTNQPSSAKGKATQAELTEVHEAVVRALDVPIAQSYICLHRSEDACSCRKPSPFFLREAARDFAVDLSQSWMVGDQDSDLRCGRAAGCRVALIEHRGSRHKRGEVEPDLRVSDLRELADRVL